VRGSALVAALALAGCAAPAAGLRLTQPVVLLGEVHDNAAQHALRLAAFEALLAGGARPALAMEQFDRDRQGDIDRARARLPRPDADALIALAGSPAPGGWHWDYYRPFVALALRYDLPLIAANVSRSEARAVMQGGLAAAGFDAAVPEALLREQAADIEASHCGMLDEAMARRMALAQVARDQAMARAIESQAARGVVLLAGNGHVRTDIGAPHWLSAATRQRSEAIGLLEDGDPALPYDRIVRTPPQPRPDSCDALRVPAAAKRPSP